MYKLQNTPFVISVTMLTAAQIICLVCFFECASQLSVINNQIQFLKHPPEVIQCHLFVIEAYLINLKATRIGIRRRIGV